jgi:glycosyltransferase involved in cell wall biosynthesis
MYSAQNIDKRFPPPFYRYEQVAHERVDAFYPCSRQAASVLRGKGFSREIAVLPLGYDNALFQPGTQSLDAEDIVLMLVGRLVPEKGVTDAIRILAGVHAVRPSRLVVCGEGPERVVAQRLAASLGVADRVELRGWQPGPSLAAAYRTAHVVLVPSRPTTVAEQFGRVIVEAQASGAVVAGYACGAISEVGGDAAVIVPLGNVDSLIASIARLVVDPSEFARRRDCGQSKTATRTWRAVAAQQASLYERVRCDPRPRGDLPRSPRRRREVARAEFGETASTPAGRRPFALPLLRRGGLISRLLAIVIDACAEFAARREQS